MALCAGDAPGLSVDAPSPLENDSPIQWKRAKLNVYNTVYLYLHVHTQGIP